jgi:hypothetical protein
VRYVEARPRRMHRPFALLVPLRRIRDGRRYCAAPGGLAPRLTGVAAGSQQRKGDRPAFGSPLFALEPRPFGKRQRTKGPRPHEGCC